MCSVEYHLESWNNGKEVPRWGVAEIQKMSPSTRDTENESLNNWEM